MKVIKSIIFSIIFSQISKNSAVVFHDESEYIIGLKIRSINDELSPFFHKTLAFILCEIRQYDVLSAFDL